MWIRVWYLSRYWCNQCKEGFYLTDSVICELCIFPCIKSKSNQEGEACNLGYLLTLNLNCESCPNGCSTCDDSKSFITCNLAYTLEGINWIACFFEYYKYYDFEWFQTVKDIICLWNR